MGDTLTVASAAILLFLVMDPLGNIVFFVSALKHTAPERRPQVIVRELLIALAVLLLFLLFGSGFIRLLGLSEEALGVAGGVVLMLIALRMVFPSREHTLEEDLASEPFIVPLAIPYVAGPSSLATVMLMMSRDPARWPEWILAIVLAWGACVPIMLAAGPMQRWLGERGLIAMERLMGLVLVTIAVQMLMGGVGAYLTHLR